MSLPWAMRWILSGFILIMTLFAFNTWRTHQMLKQRIQGDWFIPPIEFYAAPIEIGPGSPRSLDEVRQILENMGGRSRSSDQLLSSWDWREQSGFDCTKSDFEDSGVQCLTFSPDGSQQLKLTWRDGNIIEQFSSSQDQQTSFSFPPQLFAQYVNKEPIYRRQIQLADVPLHCLQATTAIEDADFLSHPGISVTGIGRAILRNLKELRFAQGASTITQQLVKNYFLTDEKTLKRKAKEQLISLLLEMHLNKDQILTNYLNVIYMGQMGPFQIRGYGAASEFYFNSSLQGLDLPQCALLAAIINSPGRYNPFRHPESALARRNLVLQKMLEQQMISTDEMNRAMTSQLALSRERLQSEVAPYFVQAALREIESHDIDTSEGLKVYTTLSLEMQKAATQSLRSHLERLIDRSQKPELQAALIAADVRTGKVLAYIGGSGFKETQFDRIQSAFRQPGSLFKPIVYLAALENLSPSGAPYHPLYLLDDSPWTYQYEGQIWRPKNYDGKFRGTIPMYVALAQSLNVPTAKLSVEVGLTNIIDLARRLGLKSELKTVPSLALGSFEVHPWEMTQVYQTIANMGELRPLHLIQEIKSGEGVTLWTFNGTGEVVVRPEQMGRLVSMLEQTVTLGTASGLGAWKVNQALAGKTGTTSDQKDAWFAGFTPDLLAISWVGTDDNQVLPFTGASAALPIWGNFVAQALKRSPPKAFSYPKDMSFQWLDKDEVAPFWPARRPLMEEKLKLAR